MSGSRIHGIAAPFLFAALLVAWIFLWSPRAGEALPSACWIFAVVPSIVLSYFLLLTERPAASRLTIHCRHAGILYLFCLFGWIVGAEGMTHSAGAMIIACSLSMIVGDVIAVGCFHRTTSSTGRAST